jgi:hypothetical protein
MRRILSGSTQFDHAAPIRALRAQVRHVRGQAAVQGRELAHPKAVSGPSRNAAVSDRVLALSQYR